MKKTLMVFACTALLAASLSACGSKPAENTDTGTASSAAASSSSSEQQQENTLTGSLDEKKNGMFVVTDAEGAAYEFTYDPSDTPKGLDDVAEGDSVTVTYTGTVSEVDCLTARHFGRENGGSTKLKTRLLAQTTSPPRLPLERTQNSRRGQIFCLPAGDFAFRTFVRPCPDTSDNPPCG
ncbi:MAG: hypothetical protein ACLVB4_00275 [Butyricicoccus sp.]